MPTTLSSIYRSITRSRFTSSLPVSRKANRRSSEHTTQQHTPSCLSLHLSISRVPKVHVNRRFVVTSTYGLTVHSPPVYRSVYQSIGRSVYQPISLSVYRSVYRSIGLSVYQPISLSVYRSIGRSVYRSVGLSVYRSVRPLSCRSVIHIKCSHRLRRGVNALPPPAERRPRRSPRARSGRHTAPKRCQTRVH